MVHGILGDGPLPRLCLPQGPLRKPSPARCSGLWCIISRLTYGANLCLVATHECLVDSFADPHIPSSTTRVTNTRPLFRSKYQNTMVCIPWSTSVVTLLPQSCSLGDPNQHIAGLASPSSLDECIRYLGRVHVQYDTDDCTGLAE